jgi:hypothetical protein
MRSGQVAGEEKIPTIRLSAMTEAQKRAYVIADNKLALNAGWDDQLLALELQYLSELELDFDLGAIGFETAEIDLLLAGWSEGRTPSTMFRQSMRRRHGQPHRRSVAVGRHRVLCGDARRPEAFAALMAGAKAQMVFADPPYNVPIDGHGCWHGQVQHREFAMASGEMNSTEYIAFLKRVVGNLVTHSIDGSIHFICTDWRHIGELLQAAEPPTVRSRIVCVWNKTNAGLGSLINRSTS